VITGKVYWGKMLSLKKNRRNVNFVYWVGVPGMFFRKGSPSQKFNKKSLEYNSNSIIFVYTKNKMI
jgi:hypothetical protein